MRIITVNKSAGQTVTVKLFGDEYKVELDDNNRAELTLYGQHHIIQGKTKKVVKAKDEKSSRTTTSI